MTNLSTSEKLKDVPQIIESSIKMTEPNSIIEIFKGEFTIQNEEIEVKVIGSLCYEWFPHPRPTFSGEPKIGTGALFSQIIKANTFKIIIDGLDTGEGYITESNFGGPNQKAFIQGIYSQTAFIGDRSIPVERIIFSVPNLREFLGALVKKEKQNSISSLMNRIELENENNIFILDKSSEYKELNNSLRKKGGYVLQYSGELTSKKGPLLFKDIGDSFHCLNTFLNFLNGRRTSALFISGFVGQEKIWSDYSSYSVNSYKYVHSWPTQFPDLSDIWQRFCHLWKDNNNKDFLTSAIHWYVEINNNAGYIEGSIIMAQTALELIYNWWIIEDKKLILGRDSENISASNKIRLLLSQLNVSASIPESFNYLKELVGKDNVADAPDAIVLIRNAIVHSNHDKRKKLLEIDNDAKYEALKLSIWYIEMALLRILEFDGKYEDRCSKTSRYVPWSNTISK